MTIGQANALALLNAMIRWSLLAMIIVLVIAIVQYTIYQPWWKDPIGFMVVFLEIAILVQIVPQEYAQWFVHSIGGTIDLGFAAVILSMLVTVGMIGRIIVWGLEWRRVKAARRAKAAREQESSTPPS